MSNSSVGNSANGVDGADTRPVFGYLRVSTEQQELERQERTIPEQHGRLPDGLAANRLELFSDHGVSAYKEARRPDFEAMKERIERGEASALIIDTSSRLTRRGIQDAIPFFLTLQRHRTRLFTTQGKEYTPDLAGLITLAVDAEKDEAFSRDLSHNVKSAIEARRAQGLNRGQRLPVGLRNTAENIPEPDDDFPVIEQVFRRFDAGEPVKALARYATEELGRHVSPGQLRRILSNPTYAGWWVEDRHGARRLTEGAHGPEYGRRPPIDRDLFKRVQNRLTRQRSDASRYSRKNPFSAALFRCAHCGSGLARHASGGKYLFNRCENKDCRKVTIPTEYLEGAVVSALTGVYLTLVERLADPLWSLRRTVYPDDQAIADIERQLASLEAAERDLLDLLSDRQMPREKVQAKLREIARDRLDLEGVRDTLSRREAGHRAALEELRDILGGEGERWPQPDGSLSPNPVEGVWDLERTFALWLALDLDERQRLLASVIERAEATRDNEGCVLLNLHFRAGFSFAAPVKSRRDEGSPDLIHYGLGGLGPKNPLGNQGFPHVSRGCVRRARWRRDRRRAVPSRSRGRGSG